MKKFKFILSLILILLIIVVLILRRDVKMKYNNEKNIASLVTERYSKADILKMREDIEHGYLDYSALKSNYNIQCLRKTYQGYYIVFLMDDGERVFVFMNEKMKLCKVLVIENIKEKKEYNFIKPGETTEREILEYDKSTILLPVSSITSTAHIVQEGLLVITYDRINAETGVLLDNPIVKSVVFFSNDEFPLKDDTMINLNVPYILEIDKKS